MDSTVDYSEEKARQNSFLDKVIPNINFNEMARSGFFYAGEGDMVECFSCQLTLHSWKKADIVDIEHLTHSPSCFFMRKKLSQNSGILPELVVRLLKERIETRRELEWVKT